MNLDQLSMQIVAINDAIQILARSNTTIESHSHQIDGMIQKNNNYDKRLRDIESLIHASCDVKAREMAEQAKDIYGKIDEVEDKSHDYAWKYAGAVAVVCIGMFYYVFGVVDNASKHNAVLEARQDDKNDKLYAEIFDILRDVKDSIGDLKTDVGVMSASQEHYQETLQQHLDADERRVK